MATANHAIRGSQSRRLDAATTTKAPQESPAAFGSEPQRQAWIDNLRVAVIIGVIASHTAIIYVLDVGWYYEERTANTITEVLFAALFAPGLLFGMGLLFFVAGLFTPHAHERKGAKRFTVDRLWRLGVPAVAYLFVIDPAMNAIGDRAMGRGESVSEYFRRTYWDDVDFGVAWFVVALLAFSLVYAAWRARNPAGISRASTLTRAHLGTAAAFIAVGSFVVRLWWPTLDGDRGWTLNLWEYPQMIALFALGVHAQERGWLVNGLSAELRRTCARAAGVGVALAALIAAFIAITEDADPFLGGLRLQATLITIVEATLALGMTLWVVDWFRRRLNHAGPFIRGLGRGSFTAYLVHAPIGILLAASMRNIEVPAELKFTGVFAVSVGLSFGLGSLLTRSRVGGRVL
jgi:glucan biosynthesis protein C